jgi:hypothetical protein
MRTQDVPIWHAKRYEPRPVLSKLDKNIAAYRRWTQQFTGAGSITFDAALQAHVRREQGVPADSRLEW